MEANQETTEQKCMEIYFKIIEKKNEKVLANSLEYIIELFWPLADRTETSPV